MGWWSATIMGGDTPLDIEGGLIVDVCGISYDDYLDKPITDFQSTFNDKLAEMVLAIEDGSASLGDKEIAYQVLGVLLVRSGAVIPDELRKTIIEAAENDEWAAEGDQERIGFINDFISTVKNYTDGEPVDVTSEGLFQKIFEGLANKNV